MFTTEHARKSLHLLGLPVTPVNLRRTRNAKWLLDHDYVRLIQANETCRIYHVASQASGTPTDGGLYTVTLDEEMDGCTCPDHRKSGICKHRIACMMDAYKTPTVHQYNGHYLVTSIHQVYHVYLGSHSGCTCHDWHQANLRTPAHYPVVNFDCEHIRTVKAVEVQSCD